MITKKTIPNALRKKAKGKVKKKNTVTRVKKSTTKKAPRSKKKITARKRTGTKAKKRMISAPLEKCFWVHNGPAISNLQELEDVLRNTMSDEQFAYHNDGINDFARWVDEVLGDAACAKALSRAKTRTGTITVVVRYLKAYK